MWYIIGGFIGGLIFGFCANRPKKQKQWPDDELCDRCGYTKEMSRDVDNRGNVIYYDCECDVEKV